MSLGHQLRSESTHQLVSVPMVLPLIFRARTWIALVLVLFAPASSLSPEALSLCRECALIEVSSRVLPIHDSAGTMSSTPMQVLPLSPSGLAVLGTDLRSILLSPMGRVAPLIPIGAGPFEQRAVFQQYSMGDTVYLFDAALRRLTGIVRGVPRVQGPWTAPPFVSVTRAKNGWIMNANVPSVDHIGFPFHFVDDSGRVVRSFGTRLEIGLSESDANEFRHRVVFEPNRNRLFTVKERRLVISIYRQDGTKEREWAIDAPFWRAADSDNRVAGVLMPITYIRDARFDAQGRMWVAIAMAGDQWKEALEDVRDHDGRIVKRVTDIAKGYRSVIAVIDFESATVAGFAAIPGQVIGFGQSNSAIIWQGHAPEGTAILREVTWRLRR